MSTKSARSRQTPRSREAPVTLAAIRRYARRIGEPFQPDKIILFGSYAYGQPDAGSDVDPLVVMSVPNETNQAIRMSLTFDPPFPLDLIVRTPKRLQRELDDEDWFLREILTKGKVLYEKKDQAMGPQGRGRPAQRAEPATSRSDAS